MRFIFSTVLTFCFSLSASFSTLLSLSYSSVAYSTSQTDSSNWTIYPSNLQQFDYSGNKLQQNWPQLAAATNLPWPDAALIQDLMTRFPQLSQRLTSLAKHNMPQGLLCYSNPLFLKDNPSNLNIEKGHSNYLLFKFVKRVVNGIHLFNHSKNGVNIQFCLLMILTVLYLNLKQFCFFYGKTDEMEAQSVNINQEIQSLNINNIEDFNTYKGYLPDLWVNSLNKIFNGLWKISSYWVENLATLITKPFDYQTISILASD